MDTDAQLVQKTLAGSQAAFGELIARHERSVTAVAWQMVHDFHQSQDLAQDAFVVAYRYLPRLRDAGAFGGWARIIVRRLASRAMPRARALSLSAASEAQAIDAPSEVDERLIKAVLALPGREREVVLLRHFDGHGVQAIADMIGESVGTVTKRLSRAHARLRSQLEGKF